MIFPGGTLSENIEFVETSDMEYEYADELDKY